MLRGFVIQFLGWPRHAFANHRCVVNYPKIAGQRLVLVAPEAAVVGRLVFASRSLRQHAKHE
jgi:hypothetical protein